MNGGRVEAVSPPEAGRQLGCHRDTVMRLVAEGHLRAFRLGNGARAQLRIEQASIDEFRQRGGVPEERD